MGFNVMNKKSGREPQPERLTRADLGRALGIFLILGAFLMLTFTPQLVFRAWNRAGYQLTEAEILSGPGPYRAIRVRVASTGEEVSPQRNPFDGARQSERIPIWYNPAARMAHGIVLFDERVVSAQHGQGVPTGLHAFAVVLFNLLAGTLGLYLISRTPQPKSAKTGSIGCD